MTITGKLGTVAAALALGAAPAIALAQGPNGHANGHANGHNPHSQSTPGPNASPGAKAKAYGYLCQKESKKHVAGQKGTPYSDCVAAAAKLRGHHS